MKENELLTENEQADYERTQATIRLLNELEKGRRSGEESGWLSLEAVEAQLGLHEV